MSLHLLSAVELSRLLAAKEVSSVELVRALFARIEAVEPKVHAFVHRFEERALTEAQKKDDERARGDATDVLHGLPITIKESISTAGADVTLGLRSRVGKPVQHDAAIVTRLKQRGAIVIGKTNVSQLLLFHESDNPIWGPTHNPWDATRTPGGSSGGEAAAIASGMSLWGVGTDIGGSIRVPAAFCGIFGLKPTNDRWSNLGSHGALPGQEVIRGQTGPLARTAADLALLFGAADAAGLSLLDPAVPPLAPSDPGALDPKKLRVGVYEEDGFLAPAASVRRAVRVAADRLRDAGVEVVPISPPDAEAIVDTYFGALSSDGGRTVEEHLQGDVVAPQLAQLRRIAGLPGAVRTAVGLAMGIRGESRIRKMLQQIREKPVGDYWRLTARRTELRVKTFELWNTARIDAVLCPAHTTPALRHGDSADFSLGGLPSMLYNFLNFPAGVAPVSRVRTAETDRAGAKDLVERRAASVEAGSAGLPLAVQVVAKPWREDVVLALLELLDQGGRGKDDFPRTPVDPA